MSKKQDWGAFWSREFFEIVIGQPSKNQGVTFFFRRLLFTFSLSPRIFKFLRPFIISRKISISPKSRSKNQETTFYSPCLTFYFCWPLPYRLHFLNSTTDSIHFRAWWRPFKKQKIKIAIKVHFFRIKVTEIKPPRSSPRDQAPLKSPTPTL